MTWLRGVAVALAVVVAGCSTGAARPGSDPGTLVDVELADGATMNPLYAQTQEDAVAYASLLFDSLTSLGNDLEQHPDLATSWTPSPDGLHWDVALRHGVRWSDGVPFTSKDVVFTYRIMRDPKTAFVSAGDLAGVRAVTALGPYRVRFDLAYPNARFVNDVMAGGSGASAYMLPEHVLGRIPPDRQPFSSFGEHPIGTGPYVLKRWQHDSDVLFERNAYYWHGVAKIPRIDIRIIFDPEAAVDALEDGSVDLMTIIPYHGALRVARQAPQIRVIGVASYEVGVMELNLARPGLADNAVRQAMMYAWDREALLRGFYGNEGQLATGIISQALTRWYNPDVRRYGYDPAQARALLDHAGWKLGPDGVRRKGATRLEFEVLVPQGAVLTLDEVLAFSADLGAVGIKVDMRQLDFPSIVERSFNGTYDMLFDQEGGNVDPDTSDNFLSSNVPPAGRNTTRYVDPVADRLLRAGLRELNETKRRAIYDRFQARLAETLPMFWYTVPFQRAAFAARVHFDRNAFMQAPFIWYNVADWELTK